MSQEDFIQGLQGLGYQVKELGGNRVCFDYVIPVGKDAGETIKLGFEVPGDFPASPPSGPHVSPRILPIRPGPAHPSGQIHTSPFGEEWEYWSRPFPGWQITDKTVKEYMSHIRHLFDTQ
jgi:hypothetical protein